MRTSRLAQIATIAAGLAYLMSAIGLLFAPQWFYETFGHFPPFNRHYMGDTGSFLLPLAVGLMLAASDPVRHRLLIGVGALASVLHTVNHGYDALIHHTTNAGVVLDFTPLTLLAVALIAAYYQPAKVRSTS